MEQGKTSRKPSLLHCCFFLEGIWKSENLMLLELTCFYNTKSEHVTITFHAFISTLSNGNHTELIFQNPSTLKYIIVTQ